MAGASDKARFYLEQYVPELQEYERKEIFTRDEIRAITAKRSDFEHTLNARGSKPSDYIRYATHEMNVDSLRKKRCKRLGVKSTTFSGQRTIFFIMDRATRKFPGDTGLWMQYVQFCQKEKANRKLAKVFTNLLRLKPREWGLWVVAAKHYAETQGDMSTARSYLQRGLRFCKAERRLWMEYMRLELVYLAKLATRRKILGIDAAQDEAHERTNEEDENMLTLPKITAQDIAPDAEKGVEEIDPSTLQKLATAPLFSGAIPIAIFDAAMKQFKDDSAIAEDFFELVASFESVPCSTDVLQYILRHLQTTAPSSPATFICEARLALFAVPAPTIEFPFALGTSLAAVRRSLDQLPPSTQAALAQKAVLMLLPYLQSDHEIDADVVKVLEASIRRYLRLLVQPLAKPPGGQDPVVALIGRLRTQGRGADAELLETYRSDMVGS